VISPPLSHLSYLSPLLRMKKAVLALLLGVCSVQPARQLRGNAEPRDPRSLVNTFPFNANDDHHHDHHPDHGDHSDRVQRQGSEESAPDFSEVAGTEPGEDGKRCIDKVLMVEEIEYDDVVQCDHSYDKRCHTTYVTNYESQQEEECEENFRKNCFIDYEKVAFNETVEICRTPLVKDCEQTGPEICRTEYESECWTKPEEHEVEDDVVTCETVEDEICEPETSGYTTTVKCSKWPREVCSVEKKTVTKYTPITGCTKEPRELCAPAGCKLVPGPEYCHEKVQTVVQDKPKEECSLEPQRDCKHVTKLVPKLTPTEECVDVPKEVCSRSRTNPKTIKKPVIKKWCYTPTEESGLA